MKRVCIPLGWCTWALMLLSSACGGGASGTCANFSPCGGNIVGTWKFTSSCRSMNAVAMVDPSCPTTVDGSKVSVTGDLTYRADMTYTANTTVSGTLSFTSPVACLTALPCSQLGVMSTAGSGRCVVAGSDCTCTFTYPAQVSSEAGTYTTTAAGLLTETPTNGTARATDYCVKGTTLTESPRDDTTMMGPSISGTVTFARQ